MLFLLLRRLVQEGYIVITNAMKKVRGPGTSTLKPWSFREGALFSHYFDRGFKKKFRDFIFKGPGICGWIDWLNMINISFYDFVKNIKLFFQVEILSRKWPPFVIPSFIPYIPSYSGFFNLYIYGRIPSHLRIVGCIWQLFHYICIIQRDCLII